MRPIVRLRSSSGPGSERGGSHRDRCPGRAIRPGHRLVESRSCGILRWRTYTGRSITRLPCPDPCTCESGVAWPESLPSSTKKVAPPRRPARSTSRPHSPSAGGAFSPSTWTRRRVSPWPRASISPRSTPRSMTCFSTIALDLPSLAAPTSIPGVSLVPSHPDLAAAELELLNVLERERQLEQRLERGDLSAWDFVPDRRAAGAECAVNQHPRRRRRAGDPHRTPSTR